MPETSQNEALVQAVNRMDRLIPLLEQLLENREKSQLSERIDEMMYQLSRIANALTQMTDLNPQLDMRARIDSIEATVSEVAESFAELRAWLITPTAEVEEQD